MKVDKLLFSLMTAITQQLRLPHNALQFATTWVVPIPAILAFFLLFFWFSFFWVYVCAMWVNSFLSKSIDLNIAIMIWNTDKPESIH